MGYDDKKVGILAENLYEDLELWYPLLRFREAGASVEVIGAGDSKQYSSKHGYPVNVDINIDQVDADAYDALVIPGGYAPDIMRTHSAMVDLVRKVHDNGKIVTAICHAGWMLASAEIVSGKQVTCYHAIKDDLIHAGAEYKDESVVQDGNIVTSRMPSDLPDFCRTILEALGR